MEKNLIETLRARTWPAKGVQMNMGNYDDSCCVREGRVFSRALRLHQDVTKPIPPGESGITSLCRGSNGNIYGATSGNRSHMFCYYTGPFGDGVGDLGVLEGVKAVRRCIAADAHGNVYAAASEMIDPQHDGPLFVHHGGHDNMAEYGYHAGATKQLAVPLAGECVAALCADPARNVLYGLGSRTGTFFRYDCATETVDTFGPVSSDPVFSHTLVVDGCGNVYGARSLGELFRFNVQEACLQNLGVHIPTVAGRAFYNRLDAAVFDPHSGLVYGGGSADGVLFVFDPHTLAIRSLGKATAEPRVRAMAAGRDGRIYGISGCDDGMGHLFRYDPARQDLADLGIMMAVSEVWRRGFEFDAACTGANGEIYFGENEWESHLYLYFPPVG